MTETEHPSAPPRLAAEPGAIAFYIFLAAVVLAPLPLGSNRLWSESLLALVVGVLLAGQGAAMLLARPRAGRRPMPLEIRCAALLFVAGLLWAAVQALPIVPEEWAHPIWGLASEVLGQDLERTISLSPHASWTVMMRLLLYGGSFALAYNLCRTPDRAQAALYTVAAAGGAYALGGFALYLLDLDLIDSRVEGEDFASLSSTFPNRSHYAAYAGLGLVAGMALLFRDVTRRIPDGAERREMVRSVLETVLGARSWLTAICLGLAAALALTNSRGGLLSAVFGLFLLFAAFAVTRRYRSMRVGMFAGLFAIMAIAASVTFGNSLDQRLDLVSESTSVRERIFGVAIESIEESPLLGSGLGTFREMYLLHWPVGELRYFERAHNSYLELASDLGMPGAAVILLGLGLLWVLCMRGALRRRRNAVFPCIAVAATGLVAVHSLYDFVLQIPAIAVTFSVLLGIGCAQSVGHSES